MALFCGAGCIALAPLFVKVSEVSPVATAFYRIALALPVVWLWYCRPKPDVGGSAVPQKRSLIVLAGLFFACDLAVWHWSITLTSVANATLLANFAPVFVGLGAMTLFGERLSGRFWLAAILGITGAAIVLGDSMQFDRRHLVGDLLGLLTAVFYGAYILTVSRVRRHASTAQVMAWSGVSAAPVLLLIALLTEDKLLPTTMQAWAIVAGLALISHAAGQSFITFALAHLSAAFSSVGLLLQPVIAALLAWWWLGEALRPWQLTGGALVLVAIAVARYEQTRVVNSVNPGRRAT